MRALRKTRPAFGAELVEISTPCSPAAGNAMICIGAAGICGSDLHAFDWTSGYEFMADALPITLGHEFAGVVDAVGNGVTEFAVGDRVTCWPTVTCGTCPGCASGHPLRCEHRRIVGLHRDGGFANLVSVPVATLRHIPDGLSLERAALTEPLAVAVNAVNLAEIAPRDRVAVLGPGPIGLAMAWVAHLRGAHVLLVGKDDPVRLEMARDLGIPHVADLSTTTLEAAVQATFGTRIDRVIEATGIAGSVEQGLAVLRPGGILVAAGIHAQPCTIDLTRLVREKKQLRGAHDTDDHAFTEAIALLSAHGNVLERLITHRLPLSRATEAFALARARTAGKVLLIPDTEVPT